MSEWREAVWAAVPDGAVPERLAERRDWMLGFVSPGDRVLDLGCGEGSFAEALLAADAEVTVADVAQGALDRAGARVPGVDRVLLAEDSPLPFRPDSFDVVWCGETLEHVADAAGLVREARRVLQPGGVFLVTVPNQPRLKLAFEALVGQPLEERLDPRADHLRFFTARTLGRLLGAAFASVDVEKWGGLPGLQPALRAAAH